MERTLQSVNGRPARKNQASRVHGSENRHARSRWGFCSRESEAVPVHPRRRGWRPSGHARDRFHRDAARARARQVGRKLLRGRRRRPKGARLVRSGHLRRACRWMCGSRSRFSFRCLKDSSAFGRPSGWRNLKRAPVLDVSISATRRGGDAAGVDRNPSRAARGAQHANPADARRLPPLSHQVGDSTGGF